MDARFQAKASRANAAKIQEIKNRVSEHSPKEDIDTFFPITFMKTRVEAMLHNRERLAQLESISWASRTRSFLKYRNKVQTCQGQKLVKTQERGPDQTATQYPFNSHTPRPSRGSKGVMVSASTETKRAKMDIKDLKTAKPQVQLIA